MSINICYQVDFFMHFVESNTAFDQEHGCWGQAA